jgi:hypothetical protein
MKKLIKKINEKNKNLIINLISEKIKGKKLLNFLRYKILFLNIINFWNLFIKEIIMKNEFYNILKLMKLALNINFKIIYILKKSNFIKKT